MEAFYFGPSTSPLLGVYYPARIDVDRLEGVVLCYPYGQEYMRAHRSFRQLSDAFSKKGIHVLRFDYRGTGDSAGNLEDVTPDQWMEDISMAIQELKDVAGISKVGILGLRMGGLLAAKVAAGRSDLSRLILWDTVVEGKAYADELLAEISKGQATQGTSNFVDDCGTMHFNGFAISRPFQEQLFKLNIIDDALPTVGRIFNVSSHESSSFAGLDKAWSKIPNYEYKLAPAPHDWNYVDHIGGIMLPQPVIKAITDWM